MSLYTVKKLYHDPFNMVQHILTEVFITLCKVSLYIVMLSSWLPRYACGFKQKEENTGKHREHYKDIYAKIYVIDI